MSLFEEFKTLLGGWVSEEYKEQYPNTCPDDEEYMLYQEGLCDKFEDMLSKQGIKIENVCDESDLDRRNMVYKLTKGNIVTHVNFYGTYDSYQSQHPYSGFIEVTGSQKTITVWE